MGILGNTRLTEVDVNYVLFAAPPSGDCAYTLSLINTASIAAEARVALLSNFSARVQKIDIVKGGKFSSIPSISISGGKTADATVSELGLADFTIVAPGIGYVVGDILTAPSSLGTGTTAKIKVKRIGASGAVVDAEVYENGAYTTIGNSTSYSFTGGTGSGFLLAAPLFGISKVTMVNTGSGYEAIPTVTTTWEAGAVLKAVLSVTAAESSIIEPAISLPADGVYERSGMVVSNGEAVVVSSNAADAVNAFAWGFTS